MFTGIIEETGIVQKIELNGISGRITIAARKVTDRTSVGDSIAVNGVCLTVIRIRSDSFTADVMPETLRRSNLGMLENGSPVNLERAMPADGRFGGHIVSGHIDGVGTIEEVKKEGIAVWVRISAAENILRLTVEKGSICIDGISLTVAAVSPADFQVSVIPHTGSNTTLLAKKKGSIVNLENDPIGKYVWKLVNNSFAGRNTADVQAESGITEEFLKKYGF